MKQYVRNQKIKAIQWLKTNPDEILKFILSSKTHYSFEITMWADNNHFLKIYEGKNEKPFVSMAEKDWLIYHSTSKSFYVLDNEIFKLECQEQPK